MILYVDSSNKEKAILVGMHEFHSIFVMADNMEGNYQKITSVLWEGLSCKAYSEVMTPLRCAEMGVKKT